MAERLGFEPRLPVRVNTLSKRAPSATRPSLQRLIRIASAGCLRMLGLSAPATLLIRYSRLRRINAQCRCERNQVVLLINKNRANGLAERIFVQLLSLL